MNTINQQIREAHKAYLSKQSLVEKQRASLRDSDARLTNMDSLREELIKLDKGFDNPYFTYTINGRYGDPTKFSVESAWGVGQINMTEMSQSEAIQSVNSFYEYTEIVSDLVSKHSSTIIEWESTIDKSRQLRKMYNEMDSNNHIMFRDEVRSLMSRTNVHIEFPSTRRFEEIDTYVSATNWKPESIHVKYRYEGQKDWNGVHTQSYEIIGKVKNNYLMNLHTSLGHVIDNVLVTPKQFDKMVNRSINELHNLESNNDTVSGYDLRQMGSNLLNECYDETNNIADDISELMGMYSNISVTLVEGPDTDHEFEVREWNSEDESWTYLKTFYFQNYLETKEVA